MEPLKNQRLVSPNHFYELLHRLKTTSPIFPLRVLRDFSREIFDINLTSMYIQCMTRTQIQFPEPLYRRLKEVAQQNDWSLADVVRRASELYVSRFDHSKDSDPAWSFPSMSMGGDFQVDPAKIRIEAETLASRTAL